VKTGTDDAKITSARTAQAASADLTVEVAYSDTPLTLASQLLVLTKGLYLLRLPESDTDGSGLSGLHLSAPPLANGSTNEAIVSDLRAEGFPSETIAVAKVGQAGGVILVSAYGLSEEAAQQLAIHVERLDPVQAFLPSNFDPARSIATEVTVTIDRLGLRRFAGGGWAGSRSRRLPIYALAVQAIDPPTAVAIEVKVFGADARESDWVTGGRLCGPFDGNRPLVGFAARILAPADQQFTIAYHGWFASAGMIGPRSGGEPCLSPMLGDPLGAITVRVYERSSN